MVQGGSMAEGQWQRVNGREPQGLRPGPLRDGDRVVVSNERRAAAGHSAVQRCMYRVQVCRGKGVGRGCEPSTVASFL
jgi:hypothetical protein